MSRLKGSGVTLSDAEHTAKQYDAGLRCHKESTASGTPYDEMRGLAKQQEGSSHGVIICIISKDLMIIR